MTRPTGPGWSQIQNTIRGARHGRGPAVEDVRIDHRGTDVVVAQQFLDGANVASVFEQVSGEGVPQRMRRGAFAEPRPPDGVEHGALQDGFAQMMSFGYLRARAHGSSTQPGPNARSASCCRFTLSKCRVKASLATAGRTVTRSLAPLPSRTMIWFIAKSTSCTLRRAHSSRRSPEP